MKLKTKLYIAAALLLMLLGNFVGRAFTLLAYVAVIGLVAYLVWPLIKTYAAKAKAKVKS
ncbi:TciB-like inhibition of cell division or resistance to colicin [Erwinia phage vB_EamM_ChrisDB]|jgi:multisubunit Na+/H+ antiporter MnhE subunit|uniref:TciB-like inhibition of cell division or resistance to colicin n=1 Tax=Erwinia phage vB_EamM_ChrisDB TaxID=1883371 RepID=UPI00081CD750|nr:TciB-like inhibition of cell division or resistance to colicin [Erwinia phage vB_EamM_ChrisDB]ANZ48578.1 hypothetical protein CHRISDB_7 [Erwinia phage vB_EamM_ChrisDB]